MDYAQLWFWTVTACFAIYFFLEGFDFGVDLLRPFLARSEPERRALINTIGPFWDGNEVWVILAAGAIFATFPLWYGALLTGLYPLFALILLALIGRGVAFEFRSQIDHGLWRTFWDVTSFIGSLIPAFSWGLIMAALVQGLPIGASARYEGTLTSYITPFTLFGGLTTTLLFMLHGATFLLLRLHTASDLHARARQAALRWGAPATVAVLGFVYLGYVRENLFKSFGLSNWVLPLLAGLTLAGIWLSLRLRRDGLSFAMSSLTIVFSVVTVFLGLFPRVLPSTLGAAYDLTIRNAASQLYTLYLMTIVGAIFLPLIVAYQAWNYYVFRHRIEVEEPPLDKEVMTHQPN